MLWLWAMFFPILWMFVPTELSSTTFGLAVLLGLVLWYQHVNTKPAAESGAGS